MRYRIKQFYWAITSNLKEVDRTLVSKYLTEKEEEVFNKLKTSEKHHCIRVCNDAIVMAKKDKRKINEKKLAKIALLHDVGKCNKPINVFEKSILVLLDKFTKGKLKNYTNLSKVDTYYNHPIKSAKILKRVSTYDKEFLEAVANHHESIKSENNEYLEIIKECDNNN
ncbi:MAG: HD domain-containing protein [Terrisporobacter sp.]|uniref:HD domain-containing protein n=1 Tax=Clostridia TaxID=186801 RepID=UPI002FCB3E71